MSLNIVLYAEGGRELSSDQRIVLAPGDLIPDECLGAAHVLTARTIEHKARIPRAAIHFSEPLRTRSRQPRGSLLLIRSTLRQLLS
jgi:hypothetical protein